MDALLGQACDKLRSEVGFDMLGSFVMRAVVLLRAS